MGIKTVPHPPYSPDLAPCDFCLFPKLRGCGYETIEEIKEAVTKVIDTLTTRGLPWGLPEVVGTVQVHCSWRRLLRRGLEFHVYTINKSAHTKKVWKLIVCTSYLLLHEGRFDEDLVKSGGPHAYMCVRRINSPDPSRWDVGSHGDWPPTILL